MTDFIIQPHMTSPTGKLIWIIVWTAEEDLSNNGGEPILLHNFTSNTHAMTYLQLFDFFWIVIIVLVLTARL